MKEQPEYSEICELEMRDLEAEFGRPLSRETALWMIRQRINRAAVELMLQEHEGQKQSSNDCKKQAA